MIFILWVLQCYKLRGGKNDKFLSVAVFLFVCVFAIDLPQSCDSNIPHVARELMSKMIHQFAIEYASKSQQEGMNGFSVDSVTSAHYSLPERSEEDGPLDLTISRTHLDMEQGKGRE